MENYINHVPVAISQEIAIKVVDSIKGTIDYNINIMNDHGIIIASSDPCRVGKFHEIAYGIIVGTEDTLETSTTDNLIGTRPGINTVLKYQNHRIGVLGITGDPNEIRPFVRVLKLATEAMIDFERQQQGIMLRNSMRNMLEASLMYGTNNASDLDKWAMELKLDRSLYRLPLYVYVEGKSDEQLRRRILEEFADAPGASSQDIVTQWENSSFVVFKAFDSNEESVGNYRQMVEDYMNKALQLIRAAGLTPRVYTGSFCHHLSRYHESYRRALWLHDLYADSKEDIVFFYDHITEWIYSFLPVRELHDVFQFFVLQCDQKFIDRMIQTQQTLEKCDYNFALASQSLYVHKNTLCLWLNNYRRYFNINPIQNCADRAFWECLCYYCKQQ